MGCGDSKATETSFQDTTTPIFPIAPDDEVHYRSGRGPSSCVYTLPEWKTLCDNEGRPVVEIRYYGNSTFEDDSQGQLVISEFDTSKGKVGLVFCGIFDGFGMRGNDISEFVKRSVTEKLRTAVCKPDRPSSKAALNLEELFSRVTRETNNDLSRVGLNLDGSGCTACMGLVVGDTLIAANVGDSRCCIARVYSGDCSPAGIEVDRVTADHNATEKDELQRMQSFGRVKIRNGDGASPEVTVKGHKGKERVVHLMRSFGNRKATEFGVVCEPELTQINVLGDTDEAYVLWASSCIFKFMSDEEVMTLVANENMEDSVRHLIRNVREGTRNEAAIAEEEEEEGRSRNMASDCSVVVLRFRRHM